MVVDDSVINWAIGAAAVAIPAISGGVIYLWKKLIAFLSPKITEAFESHTNLVKTLETNVPVVAGTLQSIGATMQELSSTQNSQVETLELHTKLHEQHSEKLTTIMQKYGGFNQDIVK